MSNDPSIVQDEVAAMQEDWSIVESLMGGTKAMRKAGKTHLEQFPDEDDQSYTCRLNRSTLLPAYSETVQNMTGRVFAEPISLGSDVPEEIAGYTENIDQQTNNLQVWSQTFFGTGLAYGLCHVLVEYPKTEGLKTKADEINAGVRPYAIIIQPKQVLGWHAEERGGAQFLTQFRYMEKVKERDPENQFAVKCVEQVRVLEPGKWFTYRKLDDGKGNKTWQLYEKGTTSLTVIPLVTFYTKRTGFMTAVPPLMELAHLNVKHWNEQSDQDKSVRFARIRLAAILGVDEESIKNIKISADCMLSLPHGADIKVVQGSAESVKIGREELNALVDDMRMAGAKLLQKEKQATKTAAQAEEEAAQELSPLETMAGSFEDAIDQVLQYFAMWMGVEEGGHCEVNGNFDVDYAPETTLPLLKSMTDSGYLSEQTLFREVQRRGVISGDLDWESEQERIESQGPRLGTM